MKDSPFIYGSTVSTHTFTNREIETEKLKGNLLNGINTAIISLPGAGLPTRAFRLLTYL